MGMVLLPYVAAPWDAVSAPHPTLPYRLTSR